MTFSKEEIQANRKEALRIVLEADGIWNGVDGLSVHGGYELLINEFLPRYEKSIDILNKVAEEVEDPERLTVLKSISGFQFDIGLAKLHLVLALRKKVKTGGSLSDEELKLAVSLRDQALKDMKSALVYDDDAGIYYNIGSLEELSGDFDAALIAYEKAAESENWRKNSLLAIQDIKSGKGMIFPPRESESAKNLNKEGQDTMGQEWTEIDDQLWDQLSNKSYDDRTAEEEVTYEGLKSKREYNRLKAEADVEREIRSGNPLYTAYLIVFVLSIGSCTGGVFGNSGGLLGLGVVLLLVGGVLKFLSGAK